MILFRRCLLEICSNRSWSKCRWRRLSILQDVQAHPQPADRELCFEYANQKTIEIVQNQMRVYENFITSEEEHSLLEELEPHLKRRRYELNHWDDAILHYREIERSSWNKANRKTLERIHAFAFPADVKRLNAVHVLDLAEDGVIKPHIDSVRFCGGIIAGVSLASPSVMRLTHEKEEDVALKILLQRCSLYIMEGVCRFNFKHEILAKNESYFKGKLIPKTRRVSLVSRCVPNQ